MSLVVGLCGAGTVGGGVVELCTQNAERFASMGVTVRFKIICCRFVAKKRDFTIPEGTRVTDKYSEILDDPEINCVIELMGGTTDAKEVVFGAISRGKHVITANKPLTSQLLPEIEQLLAEHPSVKFGYEAAVCGGIPIIHALQRDFISDNILQVAGIMNGTTNFILSKMELEGADYAGTLAEAQALGFAEADPAADVEGWDARSKLCILTKLAFGVHVPEEQIYCRGITQVTGDDFQFAKDLESSIKILGVSRRGTDGVELYVSPVIVPYSNMMSKITGAGNIIQVLSSSLQESFFVGKGAGRFPTANSVVSDMVLLAQTALPSPFPFKASISAASDFTSSFYMRLTVTESATVEKLSEIYHKHGTKVLRHLTLPARSGTLALLSEKTKLSTMRTIATELAAQGYTQGEPLLLPLGE